MRSAHLGIVFCNPDKKAIAAPVQNIEVLKFALSRKYNPNLS